MLETTYQQRRQLETLDSSELAKLQLDKLNALLATILPHNALYASKLSGVELPLQSLADLGQLPFTFKDELNRQGDSGFAKNLTYPVEQYCRFHHTSGTRGRALVVLDTESDWRWWVETWQFVLDAAELTPSERVFMAFSFGPFIGF